MNPTTTQTVDAPVLLDPGPASHTRCARPARHGERAVLLCSFQKEESV